MAQPIREQSVPDIEGRYVVTPKGYVYEVLWAVPGGCLCIDPYDPSDAEDPPMRRVMFIPTGHIAATLNALGGESS